MITNNTKTEKIAIFGGSFDPVTKSHVTIVKKLAKKFDRVIVVPGYITPFKKGQSITATEHRETMLKIALQGIDKVEISDFESTRSSISYTIDTVKHLKAEHKDAQLTVVIGSDLLPTLIEWKSFSSLKKLVSFGVVSRNGFISFDSDLMKLRDEGVSIEMLKIDGGDASSTMARCAVAFKKSAYVGKSVYEYILSHGLYNEYVPIVEAYKKFKLGAEKKAHTYRAVNEGIYLAKRHGVEVGKAVLALLLHDIGKNADSKLLEKLGLKIPSKTWNLPQKVVHAPISAEIAKQYFGVKDSKILSAIKKHTCGDADMNDLDKVVFLADFTEKGRDFAGLENIRALAADSLDLAMTAALKESIRSLNERGIEPFSQTIDALNYFESLQSDKHYDVLTSTIKEAKKVELNPNSGESYDLAYTIAQLIADKKGKEITFVNLEGKTIIADYFVIATVTSTTAVRAITEYVDEKLSKEYKIEPLRRDIDPKWAAIDYGSVIMHIQVEETRRFYELARLWSDGKNITYLT